MVIPFKINTSAPQSDRTDRDKFSISWTGGNAKGKHRVESNYGKVADIFLDWYNQVGGKNNDKLFIRGNGFLYNMVRIIAGTLLEVGRGNLEVSKIADIIASKDRANAGPTAPAKGLKLMQIEYL